MAELPPLEILVLPVGVITVKSINLLSSLNPGIIIEKVSNTVIKITSGHPINFKNFFDINLPANWDQIYQLNPNLSFEIIDNNIVLSPPMSACIGYINQIIGGQLFIWSFRAGVPLPIGVLGESSTEFLVDDGFLKPDQSWMTTAHYEAQIATTRVRNRFPIPPQYVNETVSYHDTALKQRIKCGRWVTAGVEVVSLVNIFTRHTYLYALTASHLLPDPGAPAVPSVPPVNVHPAHPTVTEQDFIWPALPAPMIANGVARQMGPAFVVPLPAACTMVAIGGPFGINHGLFRLN